MTRDQSIPNFLIDPDASQTGEVFDPNQLLLHLDHLSLRPGYTLDFVYRYDGMGGNPILYARKETDLPFETYEEYNTFYDTCGNESASIACDYLEFVVCDSSEEGYFQWVLLRMMGDQFYQYWHAGYHDAEIIASRARLEELVAEMRTTEFGISFTQSQNRQALKINPAPIVKVGDETVMVRVVWFTRWGGFYESRYTLSRIVPHAVENLESTNLMEYDCGVLF